MIKPLTNYRYLFWLFPAFLALLIFFPDLLLYYSKLNIFAYPSFFLQITAFIFFLIPANHFWGTLLVTQSEPYLEHSGSHPIHVYLADTAGSMWAGLVYFLFQYLFNHLIFFAGLSLLLIGYIYAYNQTNSRLRVVIFSIYLLLFIGTMGMIRSHLSQRVNTFITPYQSVYRIETNYNQLFYSYRDQIGAQERMAQNYQYFDLLMGIAPEIETLLIVNGKEYQLLKHIQQFRLSRVEWQTPDHRLFKYMKGQLGSDWDSVSIDVNIQTAHQIIGGESDPRQSLLIFAPPPLTPGNLYFYNLLSSGKLSISKSGMAAIILPINTNYQSKAEKQFWRDFRNKLEKSYPYCHWIISEFALVIIHQSPWTIPPANILAENFRTKRRDPQLKSEQLFPFFMDTLRAGEWTNQLETAPPSDAFSDFRLISGKSLAYGSTVAWFMRYFQEIAILIIFLFILVIFWEFRFHPFHHQIFFLTGFISLSLFLFLFMKYEHQHGLMIRDLCLFNSMIFSGMILGIFYIKKFPGISPAIDIILYLLLLIFVPVYSLTTCLLFLIIWGMIQSKLYHIYTHRMGNLVCETQALMSNDTMGTALAALMAMGFQVIMFETAQFYFILSITALLVINLVMARFHHTLFKKRQ